MAQVVPLFCAPFGGFGGRDICRMDQNPAQEKGGRLNEQHDPATGGVCWRLTFRWKRAEQKSAECVSSSYLQVFLGALTPDEMKKREREREKIKVGRLKTTNTQIEVRVVCLRRVCLTAVCSRASLTGVSLSLFVSHHLDRITASFLVRNFFRRIKNSYRVCDLVELSL